MMPWRRWLTLGTAMAMLAACTGWPKGWVVEAPPALIYDPTVFGMAGAGRDFRVEIHGDPFGGDQAGFDQRVTAAMQGEAFGPRTRFTTTPGASATIGYRVVMVFNPGRAFPDSALCGGGDFPTRAAPDGRFTIQAGYCQGGTVVDGRQIGGGPATSATAYARDITDAADPAFASLIGHLTLSLFPSDNSERRNNGGGCSGC